MHLGFSFCASNMIGGKRRSLLKQLWRQHQELNPNPSSTSSTNSSAPSSNSRDRTPSAKAALRALSKRLKDRQLETLAQVLDGSPSSPSSACVLVSRAEIHVPGGTRQAPHVLACQLWRWPNVEDPRKLRVLPVCITSSSSSFSSSSSSCSSSLPVSSGGDVALCCCNPFHWSTTIPDENPLSSSLMDFGDDDQLDKVSFDSDNGVDHRRWQTPWCNLVYREYKHHVGGFFSIYSDWTRVFQDLFHGDGMCLSLIQKPTTSRPIDRTRSKIGRGFLLSRQTDSAWLFNCSDHPIFVCSPRFFSGLVRGTGTFAVRRIPPGCSLKVYDCAVVDRMLLALASSSEDVVAASTSEGPVYLDSIHVSFVKGWGRQYTRQFITSCPCWMEILLRRK